MQYVSILLGGQDRYVRRGRLARLDRVFGCNSVGYQVVHVAFDPQLTLGIVILGEAHVHDDEGCSGPQPPSHLRCGVTPGLGWQEVQCQQACRSVEWTGLCLVDVAVVHPDPLDVRAQGMRREIQQRATVIGAIRSLPQSRSIVSLRLLEHAGALVRDLSHAALCVALEILPPRMKSKRDSGVFQLVKAPRA